MCERHCWHRATTPGHSAHLPAVAVFERRLHGAHSRHMLGVLLGGDLGAKVSATDIESMGCASAQGRPSMEVCSPRGMILSWLPTSRSTRFGAQRGFRARHSR
jgi:hypothetical protein